MAIAQANIDEHRTPSRLGLRHAALVLASPRSVFELIEDTGAYGWALLTLLLFVLLLGYTEVQTGLIDRSVDQATGKRLDDYERAQGHLVDRIEFKAGMESILKAGEFTKLMSRLGVLVFSPLRFLVSFLLISALLYAVVALTGRKPEYHTLMSICVYASFIELVGLTVRMAMVLAYRTNDLDTSLAALADPGTATVLAGIDPFRLWYWVLMAIGLTATRQLSRRMAIISCMFMGLVGVGIHVGASFALHG